MYFVGSIQIDPNIYKLCTYLLFMANILQDLKNRKIELQKALNKIHAPDHIFSKISRIICLAETGVLINEEKDKKIDRLEARISDLEIKLQDIEDKKQAQLNRAKGFGF